MSLEQKIEALTEALTANTAAIALMTTAAGATASAPEVKSSESAADKKATAAAKRKAAAAKKKEEAAAAKAAAESDDDEDDLLGLGEGDDDEDDGLGGESEFDAEAEENASLGTCIALARSIVGENRDALAAALKAQGVKKVNDLADDQFAPFYVELRKAGAELPQ